MIKNNKIKILLILTLLAIIFFGCQKKEKNTDEYNNYENNYEKIENKTTENTNNNKENLLITYQPMQCQETPWEEWIKTSDIRWVTAPTEKEIITVYLSQKYNIELIDFNKIETDKIVCMACDICPSTYYYEIIVKENNKLEELKNELHIKN